MKITFSEIFLDELNPLAYCWVLWLLTKMASLKSLHTVYLFSLSWNSSTKPIISNLRNFILICLFYICKIYMRNRYFENLWLTKHKGMDAKVRLAHDKTMSTATYCCLLMQFCHMEGTRSIIVIVGNGIIN